MVVSGIGEVRLQPGLLQPAQFLDFVIEDFPHVLHRQRTGVQDRIVEQLVRICLPETLPHIVAQLDDEILADQIGQLVRWIVRVPLHLRDRARALHARFPHEEVDRLVERHLARVQVDVDQDSAGPPDLVEQLHEFRLRVGAESGLLHHVLAVMGPTLDRLRRVREDARVRRIQARARQLQMMPGITFVDRGVPDARVGMLAKHLGLVLDRRHHVESLFVCLEPRGRVVRGERNHVPQVRRRLGDGKLLVRGDRREVVLADERLRVRHRLRRVRERLLEARGMIGLHDLFRLLDRRAGLDLFRDMHERSLAFAQILLADGVDLLDRQTELSQPDEFAELRRADAHLVLRLRQHVGPDPLRIVLERSPRFRDGLLEPRAVWTREGLFTRRLNHMQEARDALRRLEGNLAPYLDRGSNPPLGLLQEAGRPFESSGDALESPRQRSEGTHEEREQRVSDRLRTPRHRFPRADLLGLEDPDPEDVPEVPQVHALPRRQAGPIDRLDPTQEFLDTSPLFEFRVVRPDRQAVIVVVNPDIRREDRVPFDVPIDDFLREGIDLGVGHAAGIAHLALALSRGSHAGTRRPLLSRRNLPNSSNWASCSAVKIGPSRHTSWSSSEHASQMPIPHFMYRSTLAWIGILCALARSTTAFIIRSGPHVRIWSNFSRSTSFSARAGANPAKPRDPSSVAMWTSPAEFARSTNRRSAAVFAPTAVTTRAPCCANASIAAIIEAIPLPPPTARTFSPSKRNAFPYGPRTPIRSPAENVAKACVASP